MNELFSAWNEWTPMKTDENECTEWKQMKTNEKNEIKWHHIKANEWIMFCMRRVKKEKAWD
jgi:hypothetical protein